MNLKQIISSERIDNMLNLLSLKISEDYEDKDLVMIGVLNGSFLVLSDLCKKLQLTNFEIDFVKISSYEDQTTSTGEVKEIIGLSSNIEGKDVLIVDDIIDTGSTLYYLINELKKYKPNSIKTFVLLNKKERKIYNSLEPDYTIFSIKDGFIVGYGLDYKKKYRTFKDIYKLEE